MKVKCVLCNTIEELEDHSLLGKRLRNHPLAIYTCPTCKDRITENTLKRKAEGKLTIPSTLDTSHKW